MLRCCERCGAPGAVEWTETMVACPSCGVRYSEIMYGYQEPGLDEHIEWLGLMFTTDLANAWWRAGS